MPNTCFPVVLLSQGNPSHIAPDLKWQIKDTKQGFCKIHSDRHSIDVVATTFIGQHQWQWQYVFQDPFL